MDFGALAKVQEGVTPKRTPQKTSKNPVQDTVKTVAGSPVQKPRQRTVRQTRIYDSMTVERFLELDRMERRKVLGHMSDSARRKMLDAYKRVLDEKSNQEAENDFFYKLSEDLTAQIINMTGSEDALNEDLKSPFLTEEQKTCIKQVITLEPLDRDSIGEFYAPLKDKFRELDIDVPPFILLSDSAVEMLNASKISDANPVKEEVEKGEHPEESGEHPEESGENSEGSQESFDEIDTDGDGFISKEEWEAAGQDSSMFDVIDVNSDGKISKEEYEEFFGENLDDEGTEENPITENDNPENEDPENENHADFSFEEMSKVVHAVEEFMNTGDKSVFNELADSAIEYVSNGLKKVVDAFNENGEFELSEEEYEKIKEDIENELKEKGIKVPDSLNFKSSNRVISLDTPKVQDMVVVPMSHSEYHAVTDAQLNNAVITLAKTYNNIPIPFSKVEVHDSYLSLSNGKFTQNMIPFSKVPETVTREWVRDNCITTNSYVKAAQALGYVTMLDSHFYKKKLTDCCYCTDPITCQEAQACELLPDKVKTYLINQPADSKVILIIGNDPCEGSVCSEDCATATVPLENMEMSVCQV